MFYDNLKIICDQKGVKITPIVAECGGAKGSISNWKNGASPNSDIVAKLAVRLNVSSDELIFGKETSPSLPEDELELLTYYKKLPHDEQIRLVSRAEALADVYAEKALLKAEKPAIEMTCSEEPERATTKNCVRVTWLSLTEIELEII